MQDFLEKLLINKIREYITALPDLYLYIGLSLILEINAFYTVADAGEDLIGDGFEHIAEHGNGQVLAKDLYLIALLTGDVGDINQSHVHTDITHILGLLTVDEAVAVAIAQTTVQAIGIANRYGSDDRIASQLALATVTHGFALGYLVHLQNGGLEGADGMENAVVARIDTIQAETQTAHIQLAIGEVLDTSRVVDMAQNLVREGGLKFLTAHLETLELQG